MNVDAFCVVIQWIALTGVLQLAMVIASLALCIESI